MKKQKPRTSGLIARIRKVFPQVNRIVDATESIRVTVTEADNKIGRKKDFAECALAKACKRTGVAEGTLIGMAFSYLINGDTATRYATSTAVSREITSFDRNQQFEAGTNYCLSKVSPGNKLGQKDPRGHRADRDRSTSGTKPQKKVIIRHRTSNVRHLQSL